MLSELYFCFIHNQFARVLLKLSSWLQIYFQSSKEILSWRVWSPNLCNKKSFKISLFITKIEIYLANEVHSIWDLIPDQNVVFLWYDVEDGRGDLLDIWDTDGAISVHIIKPKYPANLRRKSHFIFLGKILDKIDPSPPSLWFRFRHFTGRTIWDSTLSSRLPFFSKSKVLTNSW